MAKKLLITEFGELQGKLPPLKYPSRSNNPTCRHFNQPLPRKHAGRFPKWADIEISLTYDYIAYNGPHRRLHRRLFVFVWNLCPICSLRENCLSPSFNSFSENTSTLLRMREEHCVELNVVWSDASFPSEIVTVQITGNSFARYDWTWAFGSKSSVRKFKLYFLTPKIYYEKFEVFQTV